MSLVECPDCGRDISSRAENCPNCGFKPFKVGVKLSENPEEAVILHAEKARIAWEMGLRNKWVSMGLCVFTLIGHKFYEGKIVQAIIYLVLHALAIVAFFLDLPLSSNMVILTRWIIPSVVLATLTLVRLFDFVVLCMKPNIYYASNGRS